MYEEVLSPLPDAGAYLKRIGFDSKIRLDLDTLFRLTLCHLETVPFENLDICDGDMVVSLAVSDIFQKVVTKNRGGYCFELNSLFCALLASLGFDCRPVIGRTLRGRESRGFAGHRATLVAINGRRYLCDVGSGGPSPATPLDIDERGVQKTERGEFYLAPTEYGETMLWRKTPEGDEKLISFSAGLCDPRDFITPNYYYCKAPDSVFRQKRIVNLRTREGSVSIDGDILRKRLGGEIRETPLSTPEELKAALKEHFGIII
ncbi:MAG: arylamine N-acetyltransferase [Oscillospiraceae bacterium]|nr:arylamine N-acetyltransferase [Oscillospiraceae bacterium]